VVFIDTDNEVVNDYCVNDAWDGPGRNGGASQ
jgi:hypothetical protein